MNYETLNTKLEPETLAPYPGPGVWKVETIGDCIALSHPHGSDFRQPRVPEGSWVSGSPLGALAWCPPQLEPRTARSHQMDAK